MEQFWQWLVQSGLISGDPSYYTSGKATPEEYAHALRTAKAAADSAGEAVKTQFWSKMVEVGAIQGDPNYYSSGQATPEEFEHAFQIASSAFQTSSQPLTGGGGNTSGFWSWLVGQGLIQGDPNYYASGQATPEEYKNAINVAIQAANQAAPAVRTAFWQQMVNVGAIQGDPNYYASGQAQPDEIANALTVASNFFSGGGGGSTGGAGGDLPLHILSSPSLRWLKDSVTGKFYAEYKLPSGGGTVLFEAAEEQIRALFGAAQPPQFQTFNFDQTLRQDNVHFGGNVAEVEGSGSWEEEVNRTISVALDQGNLPDWIKNDPKALDLFWVAVTEERSDDWFYSQLSKLQSFKDRYPGLDALTGMGLSVVEAVKNFTTYETKLKTLHAAAGFSPDAITPQIVGQLLTKGYSLEAVQDSYSVWKRMNDFAPALSAFNEVLQANGQAPLTGTDLYDFLTGEAPAEIYDIYEASSIREAASAAGLGDIFSADDALSLALETSQNLTVDQAYQQFAGVAAQALRFRHELSVNQYGLDVEDLIDVSFGRAPRSGKSAADVGEALARITAQAQASFRNRVGPFVGYTPQGRPQTQSLSGLRQQQ